MKTTNITYYASQVEQSFAAFILEEIKAAFPKHVVNVSFSPSLSKSHTNDYDNEESVWEFCGKLCDKVLRMA